MGKIVFSWIALIMVSLHAFADEEVSFTASAPGAVTVGDQLRLSYTVAAQKVKDFRVPSIKGFDVLTRPSRSRQKSVQIINGETTSTSSITFTYILMATKESSFILPGATITADGNQMVSNVVHINMLPAGQANGISSGNSGRQGGAASRASSGTSVSNSDLFITATASRTTLYKQGAFLLTYKIYTLVDLRGFDNVRLPDFKRSHPQEVELPSSHKWSLEHYEGRNYQTTVYRQFVLFPQQSGKLTIDVARSNTSIAKATQVADPFEAFFNGGNNYAEVKKTLATPQLTVDVKELPAGKPAGFSGGVGEFSISSFISSTNVKTNDAVTVRLVISGTGDLKLISTPEVKFPEDFEVYDPKVNNKFRLTSAGSSGSQVIEYLAIPRNVGTYKIPAVEFSYFGVKSRSYRILTTEGYELHVEKGSGNAAQTIANFTNKEDLKVLNEDVRYIKQNDVTLSRKGDFFFSSLLCWLFYIVPGVVFILFFIIYRKQIAANANVAKMRTEKTNKAAVKRMKMAGRLLADGKKDAFYDEVLKALWGYTSDKLNIPVSRLPKDNVEGELRDYGVDDALMKELLDALNNCKFARFALGDDNQAMGKVYSNSLEVISKMESSIKH